MSEQIELQQIWDESISKMSLDQTKDVMSQMGIPQSLYRKLDVHQAQKFMFGLLARMELEEVRAVGKMIQDQNN